MTCNCCSGNQSPSLRCCCPLQDRAMALPVSATCSTPLLAASPRTCQLDSSLNSGCQETCIEPSSCQRSCVVSSPCQMSCYYPRSSTPCSPCQGTYAGSLGFGSNSCHSLGYGSFPGGCGSGGFIALNYEVPFFHPLSYVSTFWYPTYLFSNTCQPSFCVPMCGPYLSRVSC